MAKFRRNNVLPENNSVDFMLGRIEDEFECDDLYDYVWQELDTGMIYYSDQWQMLQDYFTPSELTNESFDEAFVLLANDLCRCFDEITVEDELDEMTEDDVRDNFEDVLRMVEYGSDLSAKLERAFSDDDISELARLHKEYPELRDKIEDLLTDCNFHSECNDFYDENYDKYLNK